MKSGEKATYAEQLRSIKKGWKNKKFCIKFFGKATLHAISSMETEMGAESSAFLHAGGLMRNVCFSLVAVSFSLLCGTLSASFYQPKNPDLENHLYHIRDPKTERPQFRYHMRKIGEGVAIAMSSHLPTKSCGIETVLGKEARHDLLDNNIVLLTVLRAGLPLFEGFLKILENAECGFLSYHRDHATLKPVFHDKLIPSLEGKVVILVDPMIATAGTTLAILPLIFSKNPQDVFVGAAICSEEGARRIQASFPSVKIFAAALDPLLDNRGYILPGLGDAGDRSFGKKEGE